MGLLVNGQWQNNWNDIQKSDGHFKREAAQLRNWVTVDGEAGPSGEKGFKAESGRYHLYVSLACPWAHRTLIFRQIKGLSDHIGVGVVGPIMLDRGWSFKKSEGGEGDSVNHCDFMHQIYTMNKKNYTGKVSVPVLWDKKRNCIVSNESSEIIRMFNSAFNQLTQNTLDFYPESLAEEIDQINAFVYENINNGVYRCGFATTQAAYEEAFDTLFSALDVVEEKLSHQQYLVGDRLTEADWRLFTTLVRFDVVYYGHFKTNLKRLEDYSNLSNYTRALYQYPGVAETVNFKHIKEHYYISHIGINPTQVVPKGPYVDYDRPHNR